MVHTSHLRYRLPKHFCRNLFYLFFSILLETFVESMERNGHLRLDSAVRDRLLDMSAATTDRVLQPVRALAKQGRRKVAVNTLLRKSITIRTYEDWNNPPPGYFEMDLVAHCRSSVAGSHVHSLVLTDICIRLD